MSWPNEFQWFFLFLLIMKVFLFWAVAAWVVAVTADRPCAEYCLYMTSGFRDIEFLPGCDCMYEDTDDQNPIDEASIYYEPVDYIPVPVYIQNQPFLIVNPVIQGNQPDSTDNNDVQHETVQSSSNSRTFDKEIEPKDENAHETNNRHEKNVQSDKQAINAPQYLDIAAESKDTDRSASTKSFTEEELNLTEQNLSECTDLYIALHFRKNSGPNDNDADKLYLPDDYQNFSNEELEEILKAKCSQIAYIIEESLSEIKKTRSKLTTVEFKMNGDDQPNDKPQLPPIENTSIKSIAENNLHPSEQDEASSSKIEVYFEKQEHTTVISKEYVVVTADNTTPNNLNTLSEVFSIDGATSVDDIKNPTYTYSTIQDISSRDSEALIKGQSSTPIESQIETTTMDSISSQGSTATIDVLPVASAEQEIMKDEHKHQEFRTSDVEVRTGSRPHYKEGDVPLVKIITHEFKNNTVQSFINGTEDVPNGDFNEPLAPIEIDDSLSAPSAFGTNTEDNGIGGADISGNLYFVFNKHHVPAKFVQNTNGSLNLGIDGVTMCNTLTDNDEPKSALLTNICNCYKNGRCMQDDTD